MITIENLSFGYKKNKILFDNLSIELPLGNIYGLLGKNGAGKTTLLKHICGLLYPKQGNSLINGQIATDRLPSMLSDMFLIPEEFELPPISGLLFAKTHSVFYPNFDHVMFESFLAEFQVDASSKLHRLSHGQKKKFYIAFALATRTRYLILDEPTNGLDIPSKSQFRKVIASSMDENRCILISTHQVRDLASLIDHIIILDSGKVVFFQSTFEISSKLAFTLTSKSDSLEVVYTEDVMGGKAVIYRAADNETEIDLELLFNGVTHNAAAINNIFNA